MKSLFITLLFCVFSSAQGLKLNATDAAIRILDLVQSEEFDKIDSEFLNKRSFYYKKFPGAPPGLYWDTKSRKGFELVLGANSPFYNYEIPSIKLDTTSFVCPLDNWSKSGAFVSQDAENFNFDEVMFHRNKYEVENFSEEEIAFAKIVKKEGYRVVITEFSLVFWLIEIDEQWQLYAIDFDVACGV